MKVDQLVEEADEYIDMDTSGYPDEVDSMRECLSKAIAIIESHRAALDKIESMATIETVEIQRIARVELEKEV